MSDLKEMNDALKKEVVELEKKLAHIRGVRVFVFSLLLFLTQLDLIAYIEFDSIFIWFLNNKNKKKHILAHAGRPDWENSAGAGENGGADEEGGGTAAAGERELEEKRCGHECRPSGRLGERECRAEGCQLALMGAER